MALRRRRPRPAAICLELVTSVIQLAIAQVQVYLQVPVRHLVAGLRGRCPSARDTTGCPAAPHQLPGPHCHTRISLQISNQQHGASEATFWSIGERQRALLYLLLPRLRV